MICEHILNQKDIVITMQKVCIHVVNFKTFISNHLRTEKDII